MEYIRRILFDEIIKWIDRREIIAIKGPRQAGKTTLLGMLMEWLKRDGKTDEDHIIFVTFEDRELLDNFALNPKQFVERYVTDKKRYYLLIDEAQYCKDIGQKLKLVYDLYPNIKIFITGSSSLELTSQTGRFLVGRILEFRLMPFNFYEFLSSKDSALSIQFFKEQRKISSMLQKGKPVMVKQNDILINEILGYLEEYIIYGGYPAVAIAQSKEEKKILLKGITNTYIEKDIISYLQITDTIKFRKLVTMLAASNGGIVKMENISTQLGSYFKEVEGLLNILEQTYIIDVIRPYHRNLATELRKNPKVYFIDTGLRNYLVNDFNQLDKRQDAGTLAENFVLNELRYFSNLKFWRTTAKTEVDFVAVNDTAVPIEVKFKHYADDALGKNLYGFAKAYNPKNGLLITKDFWGSKSVGRTKFSIVPICYV